MNCISKNDVANSTMAEGLDVVDNPVNLSPVEFGSNVLHSLVYRVGVGVVRIWLSQGLSRLGYSKLALNFIEYHSGSVVLKIVV